MGVMVMIALGIGFVAGIRLRHLALVVAGVAAAGALMAAFAASRMNRIVTWFSGCAEEDYLTGCWQTVHSTFALGSGGVLGVGLGNSRAKWSWLPEAETDFIFAIVGEELGLVGATLVMVWLIGQALINIAVVLELLPVLGVPLPFMSVGGSALVSSLAAMGVVMAVNRNGARSVSDYLSRSGSARR
jgi:cell division protein FtsW